MILLNQEAGKFNLTEDDKNNMHEGHRDRLKERFLKEGFDTFEPHNILEFALFFVIPKKDTNELAHILINEFGSLSGVFNAPIEELMQIKGIGKHAACYLKMLPELARKYYEDEAHDVTILNSTEKAGAFFVPKFIGRTDEHIIIAVLDGRCKVLNCSTLSSGVVNEVNVSIRKIIELNMKYKAVSAIIAHNHPGGVALPPEADIETTWQICNALRMVNVKLLDHIIVAGNYYVSLRDSKKYCKIFNCSDV